MFYCRRTIVNPEQIETHSDRYSLNCLKWVSSKCLPLLFSWIFKTMLSMVLHCSSSSFPNIESHHCNGLKRVSVYNVCFVTLLSLPKCHISEQKHIKKNTTNKQHKQILQKVLKDSISSNSISPHFFYKYMYTPKRMDTCILGWCFITETIRIKGTHILNMFKSNSASWSKQ